MEVAEENVNRRWGCEMWSIISLIIS